MVLNGPPSSSKVVTPSETSTETLTTSVKHRENPPMRTLISATLLLALTACGGGGGGGDDETEGSAKQVDFTAAVEACQDTVVEALELSTNGTGDPLSTESVLRVGDGGDTVTVGPAAQYEFLVQPSVDAGQCMLRELEAPDSVVSTVSQATGLSGQQDAEWEGVNLTYSFNGNVGFSGVFTVAK